MEASTVPAVEESTGSKTIADMMAAAAARFGDHAAVKYKRDGAWHDVSFSEVGEIVSEIARGLIDLGLEPGDRVALLCTTRPEWTYADFAITSAGSSLRTSAIFAACSGFSTTMNRASELPVTHAHSEGELVG